MAVSRRRLLAAGGAAVLGAAVAGCSRDRSLEPGELTILSGQDLSPGGQRHRLVGEWNQRHPDHPAQIIEIGGVADAHHSEMVARAQSRDPTVDIYNVDITWIAEFAEAGYIRELDASDVDEDGFLERPWQTCRYGGELWALPFNTDAGLLYYRMDLLEAANQPPPGDWGGIDAVVDDVFELSDRPDELVACYAGQLAPYEGLTVNALERIWAANENAVVVGDDWRTAEIDVSRDRVGDALAWLARVSADEDPRLILPQSLEHDEPATTRAFGEGQVVFMRNWPVAYRSLQAPADGDAPPAELRFDVRPLPRPGVLGGQNLAVAADSPRPRAAQALIEFLTSEPSQRALFGRGGLPATRAAVYEHPDIRGAHPYVDSLLDAINAAKLRPATPYYTRFSQVFQAGVGEVLRSGAAPTEEFTDRFTVQLEHALHGRRGPRG